jgi:hypothetical protein
MCSAGMDTAPDDRFIEYIQRKASEFFGVKLGVMRAKTPTLRRSIGKTSAAPFVMAFGITFERVVGAIEKLDWPLWFQGGVLLLFVTVVLAALGKLRCAGGATASRASSRSSKNAYRARARSTPGRRA